MEKISFVIPVYNEEGNLVALCDEIRKVGDSMEHPYEILLVDDCSSDGSLALIKRLATDDERIRYVAFAENCGQSAALYSGFQNASGEVIVTLDADLQNDPADVPAMLELYGDYDMVTGWRYNRQDTFSKRVASRIGNGVRNRLTSETIHDTGCSLKVMNAAMLKRIRMYKGLHRFLPTLMRLEGAKVVEVKVNHRPRLHGVSKYTNLRRGIEGFYDLIVVRWMQRRHLRIEVKESNV